MRRAAQAIINWEWLILLALLPFFLFPSGWAGLLLLVIPLLWIMRKIGYGQFIPDTPMDGAILLLSGGLLLSMAAVFNIEMSFPKIAGLIYGIALFYAAVQYGRDIYEGEYHLLAFILVAGSGMALVATLLNLQSPSYAFLTPLLNLLPPQLYQQIMNLPAAAGTEVNPNEVAGVLAWLLPLLVAVTFGFLRRVWRRGGWVARLGWFLAVVMLTINTLLLAGTRSRGAIAGVIIALFIMLAIRFRWGRWLLLLLLAGFAALLLFGDLGPYLVGNQPLGDIGLQGRLEIWSRALYGIADFPFTGMGMNGFRQVVHLLYPLFTVSPTFDLGHAHNHLLQAALDLGIFGLIGYLSLWFVSAALLWIAWKNKSHHADSVFIIGVSGSLVAGWLFGVFDAIALGAKPGFIWWLLLALLIITFDNINDGREDAV